MGSFMTLVAVCEGCGGSREVYADDLFEFDCACESCGGMLAIQEDDGAPPEEDEFLDSSPEDSVLDLDGPDDLEELHDDDPLPLEAEALPLDVEPVTSGEDRAPEAEYDPEDPYELAAALLDPEGTGRLRRPTSGQLARPADLAPTNGARREELEPEADHLLGISADAPPLPNWDGGDTQLVDNLAQTLPPAPRPEPVDLGRDDPLEPADEPELLDVEVVEVRGTAGRGSRTYEPNQLAPLPAPIPDPTPVPKSGRIQPVDGSASSLFGPDLDWLALIDDRLPEDGDEDQSGRVVITVAEGNTLSEEQLKETIERLDAGAALGSLILGSLSNERMAQRYEDEVAEDGETKRYVPGGEDGGAPVPSSAQPTQAHSTLRDEGEDEEGGQPTMPHKRLDTQSWAAAFAKEKANEEDDPTQAWQGKQGSPDTQSWESPPEDPTRAWPHATPAPDGAAKPKDQATRNWASSSQPQSEAVAAGPRGSSERHLRRQSDGLRVIDKFRRENLDPALVCAHDIGSADSDRFRQLYQQIFHARNGSSPKSVLITSTRPGEGKTTVAANLAIAGARIPGHGSVLVDADPRGRGVLAAFGERSPMEGLLEALETGAEPHKAVVQFPLGSMDVVPLGIRGSNASELIASSHMSDFMRGLRAAYADWSIIVDGSAVLKAGADPLTLAQVVDGVVLVVRAGQTVQDEVTRVTEMIGRERLLGVVLNDAKV